MNPAQRVETVLLAAPQSVQDGASLEAIINQAALNASYATILVAFNGMDAGLDALKVSEADTEGGSYTDVAGLVYGTSDNIAGDASALPTGGDDGEVFGFDVDLSKRKKFLKLTITVDSGTGDVDLCAIMQVFRHGNTPVSAADRGLSELLRA